MSDQYHDIGHSKVDVTRASRQGLDEVVYGAGKSADQILTILQSMQENLGQGMATGVCQSKAQILNETLKDGHWDALSKVYSVGAYPQRDKGKIHLVSAGTSDAFVLLEAARTLDFFGYKNETFTDVGVAGLHRLLSNIDAIRDCNAIIVFAGMEGALPSVLAGLVDVPVIGVPTSVGKGVSAGGRVALESMLSSCSPGIAVVNIDNGFGAAMFVAKMINQLT